MAERTLQPVRLGLQRAVKTLPPTRRPFTTWPPVRISSPRSDVETNGAPLPPEANSRWLSDLSARAKRCLQLKPNENAAEQLSMVLDRIETDWLDLSAGIAGYLTGPRWRGLNRHQVVWGDMDSMVRHVNNVTYNRYAESARVNWVQGFVDTESEEHKKDWGELMTPRGIGLILKSIKTDFKFNLRVSPLADMFSAAKALTYPDEVTVIHKLVAKPNYESDSVVLEAVMYSEKHKRLAAKCMEDIVVYDYQSLRRTPLKPFMVETLQHTFELQTQNQARVRKVVDTMEKVVEQCEAAHGIN